MLTRSDVIHPYDEDYVFEEKDSDPVLCRDIEELSLCFTTRTAMNGKPGI
ncbi:MAG: hypothetical protein R2874_09695 [Desulfobacterales bacterium]